MNTEELIRILQTYPSDLLVLVEEGPLGAGPHCIEFERRAVLPFQVAEKLGPYRRMAAAGRVLPLLMVCETELGEQNFQARWRPSAHADRHPGAGAGRAADRGRYRVAQRRGSGGAALPEVAAVDFRPPAPGWTGA